MVIGEHLVGRADELGSLDHALAQLDRGGSCAIELVGEPGIGKTRLLAELAARAERLGHLVLTGSASELERDLPFWVFVDALDEYVGGLEPEALASLDDDVRTELAQILPSLTAHATAPHAALQNERYRTHRAVRALLERLATTKPLVLVLDDLHWADSGSAELLGALLHRPPAAPVLLALAMRPRLVPERLSLALERAHRAGTVMRVELGALTSEQAHELLGAQAVGTTATALYEESGGNPFYLEQLVRGLDRDGREARTGSEKIALAELQVPPTVAAALARELGGLTEVARLVLQGAAVAGDPFEPELAAAAAATDEPSAMDALDELLSVDLVRPTDVPRRFRFRHPLVRRAVYESTPGGWRLSAHERTAEALARRGAPVAARAHHVELSARPGDAAAVAVLREAGEAAAQRAPATAARWFDGALRLISDSAPAEERVRLLLARAGSLAATGHLAESHAALLESIAVVPAEALALRVRLVVACAGVEHLLGRYPQAHARLETALDELEDGASPEAVALMIELAVDGMYRADLDAMLGWAERAVAAATSLQDRALTAAALAVRACGAALSGSAEAQAQCEEAAQLIDRLSDDELARRLDALVYLATAEGYLDRFEPSGRHGQRGVTIGRATGQGDLFPLLYAVLGTALWVQGRMAESVEVLDGAVEAARLVDSDHGLAWNLCSRSVAAFAAGDLEHASATAEESAELATRLDPGPITAWIAVMRAQLMHEAGQTSRAADLLVASAGGEELRMIGGAWRARCLELLTRCYLAAGRRSEAERSVQAARACADTVRLPLAFAMANLAEAALDIDDGLPASAAVRAIDAAAILEEVNAVFDAAGARVLAGRALAQAGEREAAVAELERARAAFDAFGSVRYRAQAERELRKLGRHIHRRTKAGATSDAGVVSLTARELELARLVVDRKTNPEIASELFLSQKTVETHLRNIFRKLGVANRIELARAVERADRTNGPS